MSGSFVGRRVTGPSRSIAVGVILAVAASLLPAVAGAAPAAAQTPSAAEPSAAEQEWTKPDLASAQIAARRGQRRVEVESETTETSKTFVNADGSLTTEGAAAPVRVRRGDAWVDVDTTLTLRDGKLRPRAAKGSLELSAGGSDADGQADLAKLSLGTSSLGWRWPGRLPVPVVEGDTATYREVAPGVDLRIRALRDGFKDTIVIKNRSAAKATARWRLPLRKGGLTPRQEPDGGIVFTDTSGKALAFTAPAVMWDGRRDAETGDPRVQAPVTTELKSTQSGGQELVLTPDASFLSDPDTVFPVEIDPTTTLAEVNDTWVSRDATRPRGLGSCRLESRRQQRDDPLWR